MPKAYLRPRAATRKSVSYKLDAVLLEDMDKLDKRLEAAGYEAVPRAELVEDAMREVIELTTKKLDSEEKANAKKHERSGHGTSAPAVSSEASS
jgi:metal-responsive CopG/Arc/MetJ family transcriptional regulator